MAHERCTLISRQQQQCIPASHIAAKLPQLAAAAAAGCCDESLGKRFQPEPRWHLLHSIALIDTDGRMAGLDYQIAERN